MQNPLVTSSEVKHHFPVVVMQRDHENVADLNANLSAFILSQEVQFRNTPENAAKSPKIATEGGYQTSERMNVFLQKNEAIHVLREKIVMPAIVDYLKQTFGSASQGMSPFPVAWANVLRNGDWQRPHSHASQGNVVSGVYYVKVPKEPYPKGCIEFINPLTVSLHHGYSASQRIIPEEGRLLLFPPYHIHYVHPVSSEEPRVVIAFDVMLRAANTNFVF